MKTLEEQASRVMAQLRDDFADDDDGRLRKNKFLQELHNRNETLYHRVLADNIAELRAAKESEIPNFKGSDLGHFPLVSADFWTSDHLSERSRSVDAFSGTRARGTLTLKRR